MNRFRRTALPERYKPGRKDARSGEARAFLLGARHLRNLTEAGLASQFNLKPETAAKLLDNERQRRGGDE